MKCIKHLATGKVTRVSDQEAADLVSKGAHKYAPKQEYKNKQPKKADKAGGKNESTEIV